MKSASAQAALISQLNCVATLGIDPRRFLEKVLPKCRGHVSVLGRLRLVPLAIVLEALESNPNLENESEVDLDEESDLNTPDAILGKLGLRLVPGGR